MKIGLLYEGDFDESPLQIIIKRIILEINPELNDISFITKSAGGSIDGHIRIATVLFYDTHSVDLAVFVADTDGKVSKCRRIRTLVTTNCKKINPSAVYIIGFPDPELEQWFLDEENAIKQMFSLPGDQRLPYNEMAPKERFIRIIKENNSDITVTEREIYTKITAAMDLQTLLMRNQSFKRFFNAFKKTL